MTTDQFYTECTLEQRQELRMIAKRHGLHPMEAIEKATAPTTLSPWVGIEIQGTYIGVETDGYAHS